MMQLIIAFCDDPFFFFLNIQTDLHSGTTICRAANVTPRDNNLYIYIVKLLMIFANF
jgi:hypothetical protein